MGGTLDRGGCPPMQAVGRRAWPGAGLTGAWQGRGAEEWEEACEERLDVVHRRLPQHERDRLKAALRALGFALK